MLATMRILIIEDSDSIRRMLEALVAARGFEVTAVRSGAKGLEFAFETVPDVVLLDLNLTGSYDGFEVCRRLRANVLTRVVPIVIITAMDDSESKRRAVEVGASAYYTKPFSPTALLKEIDSFRRRQRSVPDFGE
jgi:DNA-binding response OmpR family regulator